MRNVFKIESPRKNILAFVTQGGHVSGKLLKDIKFRSPNTITKLQDKIKEGANISDVFIIGFYTFVVIKKHYNSKLSKEQFEEVLKNTSKELNKYNLKTTNDDYSDFKDIIEKNLSSIEFCDTSDWKTWK